MGEFVAMVLLVTRLTYVFRVDAEVREVIVEGYVSFIISQMLSTHILRVLQGGRGGRGGGRGFGRGRGAPRGNPRSGGAAEFKGERLTF